MRCNISQPPSDYNYQPALNQLHMRKCVTLNEPDETRCDSSGGTDQRATQHGDGGGDAWQYLLNDVLTAVRYLFTVLSFIIRRWSAQRLQHLPTDAQHCTCSFLLPWQLHVHVLKKNQDLRILAILLRLVRLADIVVTKQTSDLTKCTALSLDRNAPSMQPRNVRANSELAKNTCPNCWSGNLQHRIHTIHEPDTFSTHN